MPDPEYELLNDILTTGPYKGQTISKVMGNDPEYITGLVNSGEYRPSRVAMMRLGKCMQKSLEERDAALRELCLMDDEIYYLTENQDK